MQGDQVITNPRINAAVSLVLVPMLIVFFQPTLWQMLGFFLVDSCSFLVFRRLEIPLFHRMYPASRLFFPTLDPSLLAITDQSERKQVYQDMVAFPRQRAQFFLALSFLKVMPAFAYGFWVWGDRYSGLEIAGKGFAICAFSFSYAMGMAFLEYHNHVSASLATVHRESDWSQVFRSVELQPSHRSFHHFEILCIAGVLIFWLSMICMIPFEKELSPWLALAQILYLSVFAIYFVGQIHVSSRRQINQGIEALIAFHSQSGQPLNPRGLALSTNSTLAFYQKALNEMVERSVAAEHEIHRWILRKAEDARYQQLGQVTGLFLHDLATPLTVMKLSLPPIEEQIASANVSPLHVERLRFCLQQITDFVGNLRLSIRDSKVNARQASPELAHQTAVRMLSYLHDAKSYDALNIVCTITTDLRVAFPQPELNQVVLNLYTNAVNHLLENKVREPRIILEQRQVEDGHVDLIVRDNGKGFSLQTFHFITEEAERLPGMEGIGLKLTKRLVELHGGTLNLKSSGSAEGSVFVVRLPLAQAEVQARLNHPGNKASATS